MIVDGWLSAALAGKSVPWTSIRAESAGLLKACRALEVSELLHYHLTRHLGSPGWPADVAEELAQRARASAARQLVRAREIADVLQALASCDIRPVLFKGAALSYLVYESAALRPHTDTDLFIRRSEVETARRILTERGYTEPPMSGGELVFCQFQMVKADRHGLRHVLDVHWKISTQSLFADLLSYDEMNDDAAPIDALGPNARGASGSQALLLACIHPVMHHPNVERLIWLYDIHLLLRRLTAADLQRFASLAVSKEVAGICARQLTLASECFDTPLPPGVLATLSQSDPEPSAVYLRSGRRWHHEMLWNVRALGRWRDRIRLLREVLFPPPRYMVDRYHLGPSGVLLLPALYLHRGVYGAFKILAGRK